MSELKEKVYQISMLQQKIDDLKKGISEITESGYKYSQDEIDFLYWETDLNTNLINKSDKTSQFVRQMKPTPTQYTIFCNVCGDEYTKQVSSRDALNKLKYQDKKSKVYFVCKDCADRKAKEPQIESEWSKRMREYRQEIDRLKRIPYKDYLQSDHWRTFRAKVIKRYDGRCQLCNSRDKRLNVHHRSYENRAQETYTDVILLCEECHAKHHGK